MKDSDPICVCGVARSEHQLCGCPDGFEPRQHPDVVLAREHRKVRERYEDMQEREQEIDLRAAMRDLAEISENLAFANMIRTGTGETERQYGFNLYAMAKGLRERLT